MKRTTFLSSFGHPGYYTLITDSYGHVFRMSHGQPPPEGFAELEDVCYKNGILKNRFTWAFHRARDVSIKDGKVARKCITFSRQEIESFKKEIVR